MTFYFYDLETSGFDARRSRIMQFAGQRADTDLKPIGKPDNLLIKMTPDILPDPDAVLVHGITPQKTLAEGISEAEFSNYLTSQVCKQDTIMVGFNNIRFDDEFIRFTLWRNFHDAYEWHWKNGCSRWDLLDVVRMMRALRPEGIEWPFASDGKASNRLELLSKINNIDHTNSHDALSDVQAVMALAQLVKTAQPKLFDYLLRLRDKKRVKALITEGDPFLYTSGRYPSEFHKTTIAVMVAEHPDKDAALVYDLRVDPAEFIKLTPQQLVVRWLDRSLEAEYFPIKVLSYNRCPAVAPLNVLTKEGEQRIQLNKSSIDKNWTKLLKAKNFADKLVAAAGMMKQEVQTGLLADEQKVDGQLYDGFISNSDKTTLRAVRAAKPEELADFKQNLADIRLRSLLPLYKARNFPKTLTNDEQEHWQNFLRRRLLEGGGSSAAHRYFRRIEQLLASARTSDEQRYLLEELNLYGESVLPAGQSALKAAF